MNLKHSSSIDLTFSWIQANDRMKQKVNELKSKTMHNRKHNSIPNFKRKSEYKNVSLEPIKVYQFVYKYSMNFEGVRIQGHRDHQP